MFGRDLSLMIITNHFTLSEEQICIKQNLFLFFKHLKFTKTKKSQLIDNIKKKNEIK